MGGETPRRFWLTARGFWSGALGWVPWTLIGFLVVCVVLQLLLQYRFNIWNRDFFNALERRDGAAIWHQTSLLPVLAAMSVVLAVCAVWGPMTFQRQWRDWLTTGLLGLWLTKDNYRNIDAGAPEPQLAEYRIAEDVCVATDAPIDLLVGRNMANVIERKNQAESELKFAVARVREGVPEQAPPLEAALADVIRQWRRLCGQHMRTTLVSHGNTLLAPLVGLILCVPKYIEGAIQLGEATQAAAAFAAVQGAFNWLVDNYPRLAQWASSASRMGILLLSLDRLEGGSPDRMADLRSASP